jgi:hypothetical protein
MRQTGLGLTKKLNFEDKSTNNVVKKLAGLQIFVTGAKINLKCTRRIIDVSTMLSHIDSPSHFI